MPMQQRYYVYVLRSLKDKQFYVGFTNKLPARVTQADATHREKYLKTAWGKRYVKTRLGNYLTG